MGAIIFNHPSHKVIFDPLPMIKDFNDPREQSVANPDDRCPAEPTPQSVAYHKRQAQKEMANLAEHMAKMDDHTAEAILIQHDLAMKYGVSRCRLWLSNLEKSLKK